MEKVKISSKFQITVPKELREPMQLRPGEELRIQLIGNTLYIRRPTSMQDLCGIA